MCCEKIIYNYVNACLFDVRNVDLPRKVKLRERYKKPEFKVDKGCCIGRNFRDFTVFIGKNHDTAVVQMDTVIGRKGGRRPLTIRFVQSNLMLVFLRDANTSQPVIDVYNGLDKVLGEELFHKLFPVILADNGSEFSNSRVIEYGEHCVKDAEFHRTSIYYCDPGSLYQKGACEVNHELIRRVIPKGTGMDEPTQEDIFLMMKHINSNKRKN